jgi:cell division septation protein DedD
MPEPGVREIQLTRKQVVFLFMATVVLAVAIFLLGISVGRGVRSATGEPAGGATTTEAAVDTAIPPAEMPPPTETTPADLSYHDQLQGEKTPPAAPQPHSSTPANAAATADATPPPATVAHEPVEAPAASEPATPRTASRGTTAAARPPAASSTAEQAPARATTGGWVVQVGAYRSRQNANRQVSRLRAKGYTAFVAAGSGSLYHVRVGPFPARADADRTATRLQREEGLKPLVTR